MYIRDLLIPRNPTQLPEIDAPESVAALRAAERRWLEDCPEK